MEEAGIEQAGAGNSLEQVKQQLQQWRAGRKQGEHIPAPLWAAGVGAAKEHGLHRVAIELHLDYAGCRRGPGSATICRDVESGSCAERIAVVGE